MAFNPYFLYGYDPLDNDSLVDDPYYDPLDNDDRHYDPLVDDPYYDPLDNDDRHYDPLIDDPYYDPLENDDTLYDPFVEDCVPDIRPSGSNQSRCPPTQLSKPVIKDNKFTLSLDMHRFKPEEVQVKLDDKNMIQVRGKKEVKSEDGSGYECQEYVRHFSVPENVNLEMLTSKLDKDGMLKVEAPLKPVERSIPVEVVRKH